MREKYLKEIREKLEINNNLGKKKKIIEDIISYNKWYIDVTLDVFLNILHDIGYDKEESIKIYMTLLNDK